MRYRPGSVLNRLRFAFDRDMRMSNVTERFAAAYGDAPSLLCADPCPWLGLVEPDISFRQLHEAVGRLATVLQRGGLQRFGRVAIYKGNGVDYYVMALAVMRAGGIAVPVHGDLPAEAFTQYAAYTGCEVIYTDDERLARLDTSRLPGVKTWIVPSARAVLPTERIALDMAMDRNTPIAAPVEINRHDDALIVHTSGTTGFPKGVLHSSASLIHSVRVALLRNPWPTRDKVLLAAHLNHHISFTSLLAACMTGAPAGIATDLEPQKLLDRMEREQSTVFFAFPDIYQSLIAAGLRERNLPMMRYWISGGDAMHEAHIRACVEKGANLSLLGWRLRGSLFMEMLGTSEVGSAALVKISTVYTRRYNRYVGRQTLIGPKVKVADAQGRALPAGVPGRLMVSGPTLFKGYWNLHEKLHHVTVDGWWWTGDMALKDRQGRIFHLDREADMVTSREGPVFGLPIEEVLLKCNDIGEAAVIGVPHPSQGCLPVAVVHSLSGAPVDPKRTLEAANEVLAPNQRLHAVIDVGQPQRIPRGLTGKVLKRELRDRYRDYFGTGAVAALY